MTYFSYKNIFIFSFGFLISLSFLFYSYSNYSNIIDETFHGQIKISKNTIENEFKSIENDYKNILLTISEHKYIKDYFNNKDSEQSIKQLFKDFSLIDSYIFQLRILDIDGQELIRLNKENDNYHFSDKSKLQDKSERYYFKDFMKLNKNDIGISYLDLNIENSQIQKPFIGTLRLATPVFIDNKKVALVIINVNMNEYIKDTLYSPFYNISFIDKDGFFIFDKKEDLVWSKYQKIKTDIKKEYNISLNSSIKNNDMFLEEIDAFKNKYYLLYIQKDNTVLTNTFLNKTEDVTILLVLSIIFFCIPFIYLILNSLKIQKNSNKLLIENKNKIELILDNTSDAIILINKKGIIKEINKSTIEMFKYSKDELINQNINILIPEPHHSKHDNYLKNHGKNIKSKIINQNRELLAQDKNKNLINITLTVTQLMIEGEIYFIGTIQNLTNDIKNKKLFENVFNSSPIGIALVSKEGTFLQINDKFSSIVGYENTELLKLSFQDITYKDDLEKDLELVSKVVNKEIDTYSIEKRYITKDSTIVWVKLTVTASYEDSLKNNFSYFIATIEDITKYKSLEDEKRQKEMLLLQQSKLASMGEMIGAIAHQWRQPLNSIGFIVQDMISAYKHNEFDEKYLYEVKKEMMDQLNYMSDTIDQFRNFFKKDEDIKEFNLIKTVLDVESLFRAQLHAHKLKLSIKINNKFVNEISQEEKDKFTLKTQEGQLKQVIINLIANSKDAILANKDILDKLIYIDVEMKDEKFEITVRDYAGGIKKKDLDRIFEPYYTTKEMGTGLGLFIVKTICEKNLNSKISYKSLKELKEDKKGSSFTITIPK